MAKGIPTPSFAKKSVGNIVMIDPRSIVILAKYNVREPFTLDDPDDAALYASIGVRFDPSSPLLIAAGADGKPYLIRGHRRLDAVMLHIKNGDKIAAVPCMLERSGVSDVEHQKDLVHSNTGKRLTIGEIGTVCQRLLSYGLSKAEIAADFGYTERHIDNAIEASNADPRLKVLIKARKVSATLAAKLRQKHGETATLAIVETALTEGNVAEGGAKDGQITERTVAPAEIAVTGAALVGQTPAGNGAGNRDTSTPATRTATAKAPAGNQVAVLNGPFAVGTGDNGTEIWDASKAGIAWADSPALARALVDLLNLAWHAGMYKPAGVRLATSNGQRAAAQRTASTTTQRGKVQPADVTGKPETVV